MDLPTLAAILALGFGGGVLSAVLGIRLGRRRPASTAPVCACKHGINYHDPETGRCHATRDGATLDVNQVGYGRIGVRTEQIQCTCRLYVGPEIMPSVWGAPIADPGLRYGQALDRAGAAAIPGPATTLPPPPPPSTGAGTRTKEDT